MNSWQTRVLERSFDMPFFVTYKGSVQYVFKKAILLPLLNVTFAIIGPHYSCQLHEGKKIT